MNDRNNIKYSCRTSEIQAADIRQSSTTQSSDSWIRDSCERYYDSNGPVIDYYAYINRNSQLVYIALYDHYCLQS